MDKLTKTLVENWDKKIGGLSGGTRAKSYPEFKQLVSLGRNSALDLLKLMGEGRPFIALVLQEIYGLDPVPKSAKGSFKLVLKVWRIFIKSAERRDK